LRKKKEDEGEDKLLRSLVKKAREVQAERFANVSGVRTNSEMSSKQVDSLVRLTPAAENFIKRSLNKNLVSARGFYRMLKTAQTIADLDNVSEVDEKHISEAFQYRVRRN